MRTLGGLRKHSPTAVGAVAAVIVAALGSGCGGDDDSSAKQKAGYSFANESPTVFATRVAKLLQTSARPGDCEELAVVNGRSVTRFPCPTHKGLRKSMAAFKVLGADEYGRGAVVDYTSGTIPEGASMTLFAGVDRGWGIGRVGLVAGRTVGTSDEASRDDFDDAMEGYLGAVRRRDCRALEEHTLSELETRKVTCRQRLAASRQLARRLEASPEAQPQYQGGNKVFGFYSLETAKPAPAQNLTISVGEAPPRSAHPFIVIDVTLSQTAAEQRRAVRAVVRQQRQKQKQDGPERSQSRKADED